MAIDDRFYGDNPIPLSRVTRLRPADDAVAAEARHAAELVRRIRAGDRQAETDLVERYGRGLRFLLMRRAGDDERARDLLQETLVIAIEKLRTDDIDNPERLAGYLRGIAIRVAMNAGRKRRREPVTMDIGEVAAVADIGPRPFEQLSAEDNRRAVARLLDSMTVARDRELLIRYYLREEDKPEICSALGLSSLHFNRVLFRARARFRKLLEEAVTNGAIDGDRPE